ncbi:hypothetical protein [Pseudomonas moorei]|uniref:hypothetical protein n=1 Tax=Pseudomonas moorei TaxID=395599 RepID=UPI0036F3BBCA
MGAALLQAFATEFIVIYVSHTDGAETLGSYKPAHDPGARSCFDHPENKQEVHKPGFDMLIPAGNVGVLLIGALYTWLLVTTYRARYPYSLSLLIFLMIFPGKHFMLRQPVFSLYRIIRALAVRDGSFITSREKPQSN